MIRFEPKIAIEAINKIIEEVKSTNYESRIDIIEKSKSIVKAIFGDKSANYKDFESINFGFSIFTDRTPHSAFVNQWETNDKRKITSKLKAYIEEIKLDSKFKEKSKDNRKITNSEKKSKKIFIVHGHDKELLLEINQLLTILDFTPVILHKQPNQGRTIIEKFEDYSDVGYAIILLTPDDLGKEKRKRDLNDRARQNVVFEFGFFVGKLGRENVFVLYRNTPKFEKPSEIDGLIYVSYDDKGAWKMDLIKEFRACGYEVDANKII